MKSTSRNSGLRKPSEYRLPSLYFNFVISKKRAIFQKSVLIVRNKRAFLNVGKYKTAHGDSLLIFDGMSENHKPTVAEKSTMHTLCKSARGGVTKSMGKNGIHTYKTSLIDSVTTNLGNRINPVQIAHQHNDQDTNIKR